MFHFLQKKMVKKICNKGTINVLQGERERERERENIYCQGDNLYLVRGQDNRAQFIGKKSLIHCNSS